MIYNKSTHPVEVKKISIRLWTLRDEIESAIERRMKECEAAGIPLYVDDIKQFYNISLEAPLTEHFNVIPLNPKQDGVTELMESLGSENGQEEAAAEASSTLKEAEETLAEQELQGPETKKPNPILDRPFHRSPPDLDKISYGFSLLSDINMQAILCFTKNKFLHGQHVIVEFLIPQGFTLNAEIFYCHYYTRNSRIISPDRPDYRVQCKFTFQQAQDQDTLRKFLTSIWPGIPEVKKKTKKEASEDESLGF